MPTPLTTIQSWPRPQLESAFTQREWQLGEAMKTIEAQRRAISAIKGQRDELRNAVPVVTNNTTR